LSDPARLLGGSVDQVSGALHDRSVHHRSVHQRLTNLLCGKRLQLWSYNGALSALNAVACVPVNWRD
jgi:hypothetical protein